MEKEIWKGQPSQKLNFCLFVACIFIIPIPFAFIAWLKTKYWIFEVTDQRIKIRTGIFSRTTDETELYRIKDIQLNQPFLLRMFRLGNIKMITSDKTHPIIIIPGLENSENIKDKLRIAIEKMRVEKGVVERDYE